MTMQNDKKSEGNTQNGVVEHSCGGVGCSNLDTMISEGLWNDGKRPINAYIQKKGFDAEKQNFQARTLST